MSHTYVTLDTQTSSFITPSYYQPAFTKHVSRLVKTPHTNTLNTPLNLPILLGSMENRVINLLVTYYCDGFGWYSTMRSDNIGHRSLCKQAIEWNAWYPGYKYKTFRLIHAEVPYRRVKQKVFKSRVHTRSRHTEHMRFQKHFHEHCVKNKILRV